MRMRLGEDVGWCFWLLLEEVVTLSSYGCVVEVVVVEEHVGELVGCVSECN